MSEDTLLIQQTLAGDEQAFHHLAVKYQSAIYSLILSYIRNPDDAQEIMQDVFLKAYQGLSSLRQSERFRFWLYQLARNQCQDWKRKNQAEFQQLTDKTADDAYPVDELLILRETLARIMQAIDELPETEKQILKERYLDDSSYAEMQAKHGLSYKALNMRLLRARHKVRARVEKLLAGIGIFSWQGALNKMLSGGVEAVKISAKIKIITVGIAAVLILSGTGIIIWHTHQSAQETQNSAISQNGQQTNSSLNKKPSVEKTVVNKNANKPIDKHKEDAKESQSIAQTDSLKESTGQETKKSEIKVGGTVDPEEEFLIRNFGLTRAEIKARLPVMEEEIKTEMFRIIDNTNKLVDVVQSGQNRIDPEMDKWCRETSNEVQKAWDDLAETKLDLYQKYKIATGDIKGIIADTSEGGWICEMQKLLEPNITPPRVGQVRTGRD